ncbi:hypothetical protein F5879DRAFT_995496 [Lentinula edodes]|uniref:Uncharacterized protein n=1 Tax=Lentinula lateritia TaxID=40482 RepID=A0A9W9DNE1_9AGAR|nr:uncharacterized protein C8R40DRAFT_1168103 [Lentinula edodes]KAH7878058.1 hypothetical protein C8R40DRAFT_1168103 [Lentinula edodes]KAJ3897833.1 hypothetical protein F5879DRAFT_995496 [Lentinula edodes]KAJ4478768.1 hypothetical protein C8J55DRAFT_561138 [Lentinula edodes]
MVSTRYRNTDESDRNKLGGATDFSDQDKDKNVKLEDRKEAKFRRRQRALAGSSYLPLNSRLLEETLKNMPAEDIDGEVEEVPQTHHKLSWSSPLIRQFYDKLGQQNTK